MTEDHDSQLSDLYRQSSQETPAARLDRAVLDMARTSVHRRLRAPFGHHWAAGGALAGVVIMSVLLILAVPRQSDHPVPARDAIAPSSQAPPALRRETSRMKVAPSELPLGAGEKRAAPAAPGVQFQFLEDVLDRGELAPEAEDRTHLRQSPAPSAATPADTVVPPAGTYFLQAGSFRDRVRAVELRRKLAQLGFECDVQTFSDTTAEIRHRVRVGPYTDLAALAESRRKLAELAIETRTVTVAE